MGKSPNKKVVSERKAAGTAKAKNASTAGSRQKGSAETSKYEQSGAPWWKQHLRR